MYYLKATPLREALDRLHFIDVDSKTPPDLQYLVPRSTAHRHVEVLGPGRLPLNTLQWLTDSFDLKSLDKQPGQEGHVDPFLTPWVQEMNPL